MKVNSRNLYPFYLLLRIAVQHLFSSEADMSCPTQSSQSKRRDHARRARRARPPSASDICGGRLKGERPPPSPPRRGRATTRRGPFKAQHSSSGRISLHLPRISISRKVATWRTEGKAAELTGSRRKEGRKGRFTRPFASLASTRTRRGRGGKAPFSEGGERKRDPLKTSLVCNISVYLITAPGRSKYAMKATD